MFSVAPNPRKAKMHHTGTLEAREGPQRLSFMILTVLGSAKSQESENASHRYPGRPVEVHKSLACGFKRFWGAPNPSRG